MIVGCYHLQLYCKNGAVSRNGLLNSTCAKVDSFGPNESPGDFTGSNLRMAKRLARECGWVFYKDDVICPYCANPGGI